jgi:hypothetical protein
MDGRVVEKLLQPGFLEAHPPGRANYESEVCASGVGEGDSAEMEDLLKGLGYLN